MLKTDALTFERQGELARDLLQLTGDLDRVDFGPLSREHITRG